jgi:hypothetical protein
MPGFLGFVIPALLEPPSYISGDLGAALAAYLTNADQSALTETPADELGKALAPYITKADLWIETYAQNPVIGRLDDGTTTVENHYVIPPAAIKAQLKQLLMDLLADEALLPKLQGLLPEDYASLLLNPSMRDYYFTAIDALPMEDNLTIDRTVNSKTAETLALSLALPLYDKEAGPVTLSYSRTAGTGQDLPDENIISMDTQDQRLRLEYQSYQSMTDVTVYQGSILREPRGARANQGDSDGLADAPKTFAAAFTLTHKKTDGVGENNTETLTHDYQLTLEPLLTKTNAAGAEQPLSEAEKAAYVVFPAFDLALSATFESGAPKNSPTSIDVKATLSGEEIPQVLDLTFIGTTRSRWAPEPVANAIDLGAMDSADMTAFLAQAGFNIGVCFLPFLKLPAPPEAPAPSADVDTPVASPGV